VILDGGRPLVVESEHDRIGRGAWARLFASAIVGDESAPVAERGRAHARAGHVHTVSIEPEEVSAEVDGCVVTLSADRIPPRVWSAVARGARNERLLAGVEGREQSVHLEHVMRFEWDEPLIPDRAGLRMTCICDGRVPCEHVIAVAYVVADQIDRDPVLLLRWRGVDAVPESEPEPEALTVPASDDAWEAGRLPTLGGKRPLPAGAVLKSLGASGIRAGFASIEDVLQRAYESFSR
jgi:uncharacterized Zn finger protein